jgi:hypothetical protein
MTPLCQKPWRGEFLVWLKFDIFSLRIFEKDQNSISLNSFKLQLIFKFLRVFSLSTRLEREVCRERLMNWQNKKDPQITFLGLLFLNFEVSNYLILTMLINLVFKVINEWIQWFEKSILPFLGFVILKVLLKQH